MRLPLPENNSSLFHAPRSGRRPRGAKGLSKAGPEAPALPAPSRRGPPKTLRSQARARVSGRPHL